MNVCFLLLLIQLQINIDHLQQFMKKKTCLLNSTSNNSNTYLVSGFGDYNGIYIYNIYNQRWEKNNQPNYHFRRYSLGITIGLSHSPISLYDQDRNNRWFFWNGNDYNNVYWSSNKPDNPIDILGGNGGKWNTIQIELQKENSDPCKIRNYNDIDNIDEKYVFNQNTCNLSGDSIIKNGIVNALPNSILQNVDIYDQSYISNVEKNNYDIGTILDYENASSLQCHSESTCNNSPNFR